MAAPRKLPPADELRRLVEAHGSVAKLAQAEGWKVPSIYRALKGSESNLPSRAIPGTEFMPWIVTRDHMNSGTGRRLRYAHALHAGDQIPSPIIERDVRDWMARLEDNDFVISYHVDTPCSRLEPKGGFFFRPRRSTDLPGLMQEPSESECPPSQDQVTLWAELFARAQPQR